MSNDPSSGGEQQPGWHGQQPYPGGYGQQPDQPAYGSYPQSPPRADQPAYGSYPQPGQQPRGYGQATPGWQQTPGQQRYPGNPLATAGLTGMAPQRESARLLRRAVRLRLQLVRDPGRDQGAVHPGPGRDRAGLRHLVISGFVDSAIAGLALLVGGAIGVLIYVIFLRITLEFYYAVVRMSEDIRAMRNRT